MDFTVNFDDATQVKDVLDKYKIEHHSNEEESRSKGGLPGWKKRKLEKFIALNLSGHMSSRRMAEVCQLSSSQFHRAFLASFGSTPHHYVACLRIAFAGYLLAHTTRPITAIALDCGMSDQSHLSRTMQKYLSITPLRLRKVGKEGLPNEIRKLPFASAFFELLPLAVSGRAARRCSPKDCK